jgi:hypothetical protein
MPREKCLECELLVKEIKRYQRKPYIVLKHEGKYYKAYEIKEITSDQDQPLEPQAPTDWVPFSGGQYRRVGSNMEIKILTPSGAVPLDTPFGGHPSDFARPPGYEGELLSGTTEIVTHLAGTFLGTEIPPRQERVVRTVYRVAGWTG